MTDTCHEGCVVCETTLTELRRFHDAIGKIYKLTEADYEAASSWSHP